MIPVLITGINHLWEFWWSRRYDVSYFLFTFRTFMLSILTFLLYIEINLCSHFCFLAVPTFIWLVLFVSIFTCPGMLICSHCPLTKQTKIFLICDIKNLLQLFWMDFLVKENYCFFISLIQLLWKYFLASWYNTIILSVQGWFSFQARLNLCSRIIRLFFLIWWLLPHNLTISYNKNTHLCLNTSASFIPYFRILVFGILVTLVAWFSFSFFLSCPSCLAKCRQRLRNIFVFL